MAQSLLSFFAMPFMHKALVALVLVLPGGIVLGPALILWLRRGRNASPAPATSK